MSDLTAELNLALCIDDDDTADYLTQTAGLRGSLNTIDGLFNQTTGHNHQGAHQGGGFQDLNPSRDMTVGRNLTVVGTATVQGNTHLTTVTADSTLSTGGLATLQSLDVTTTSRHRGAATFDTTLTVTGALTASSTLNVSGGISTSNLAATGYITAGPVISGAAGDLNANRGNGTGYVFMGSTGHYIGFDGSNYQLPSNLLYIAGDRAVTETASQNLVNKTLGSPTINGVVGWNTQQNLVAASKQNGLPILSQGANASDWIMDYGSTGLISVPNGGLANQTINFNRAFSVAPYVLVTVSFFSGTVASITQIGCIGHNTTTTGFQADFGNATGGGQGMIAAWIAIGR